MKTMTRLITTLLLALGVSSASAAGGGYPLDHFPTEKLTDQAALQNGAKLFVNYCLGCHGASAMRYNRLRDIGLTEQQIKENLLFTGEKVGEQMKIAMRASDAKLWFGALPPDLSVIARSRASGDGSGARSTAIRKRRPAGTTRCSTTWACRTRFGSSRAAAASRSRR